MVWIYEYYEKSLKNAVKKAREYVEHGVDYTYAVVSSTVLPENFDFDEGYVEDETYLPENVVYSVAKFDGKLVENFIEKENTDCYGAGSTACMEFCKNCNE